LNDLSLACRETRELRLTDSAMGEALRRVLKNLGIDVPQVLQQEVSFIVLFAFAAKHWGLAFDAAALGLGWSWLENQVAAATKLVPLGQTQAQQLLNDLQPLLPQAIEIAKNVEEDFIGAGLPALAIASSRHETQYSRLFRS
jgi:urease accessory protein